MVPAPINKARTKRKLCTPYVTPGSNLFYGRSVKCTQTQGARQVENNVSYEFWAFFPRKTVRSFSVGAGKPVFHPSEYKSFAGGPGLRRRLNQLLKHAARVQNSGIGMLGIDHLKHHVITVFKLADDGFKLIAGSGGLLVYVRNNLAGTKLLQIGK